jgi:mRNA-degrading endonuclease RelE of RelBE toxin-antitoxin system
MSERKYNEEKSGSRQVDRTRLRKVGELGGFWKDRVGKYRIIYKIDETRKELVFYDVDLRKRAYL